MQILLKKDDYTYRSSNPYLTKYSKVTIYYKPKLPISDGVNFDEIRRPRMPNMPKESQIQDAIDRLANEFKM